MNDEKAASAAAIELNRIRWSKETPDPAYFSRLGKLSAIKRKERKLKEAKLTPPPQV